MLYKNIMDIMPSTILFPLKVQALLSFALDGKMSTNLLLYLNDFQALCQYVIYLMLDPKS